MLCDVFNLLLLWGPGGSEDTVWHPGKRGAVAARKQLKVVEKTDREDTEGGNLKLLEFPTSNKLFLLSCTHTNNHTYTRGLVPALYISSHSQRFFLDLSYIRKDNADVCVCLCVSVLPWVAYILYTHSRKKQMRCNMFHSVKTNKALIQSDLLVSTLPCPKCVKMNVSHVNKWWRQCLVTSGDTVRDNGALLHTRKIFLWQEINLQDVVKVFLSQYQFWYL